MRIVSLLPSATEIVASLGMADCLVGRSHECDYPAGVERLPVLTAAKISLAGPSAAIDRDVKAVLRDALAVYRVDAEGLRALKPDVIVTQSQCDVCAVSLRDVEAAIRGWTDRAARLVSLHPYRLADVWRDLQDVAAALGVPDRGAHVAAELAARMEHVAQRCGGRPRPRVAWLEWTDPPMACGTWIPEIVAMAGGDNLFGAAGEPAPWLDWEALVAADPDVLVVAPCGFDLARTRAEAAALA
ncbi:MAG: ABC transporter substrate-binding protein, partial [Alphaproteobacteria bacterium]|nr:ABC transporter substrate-binding protein [Alphaproteobacteria bacterium]